MPIYEYRCADCGFQDEFLQKLSEPQMTVCPSCGRESLKKLLSAAGFQLKGSGWYATDFKGSGAKPSAKSDAAAKPVGEGAAATSESKTSAEKPAGDSASTASKAPPVAAAN